MIIRKNYASGCVLLAMVPCAFVSAGCSQETKEAVPHTDPAKVEKAKQASIEKIKNDPSIPADQKARALQYMGGNGQTPLGATNDSGPAAK